MIYLRSSRRGASPIGVGAGALDHDYIDALTRLTEPSGLRLKIEASNGTELQGGIKSTTLSARLFATDGTDLTAHLAPLLLTWEVGVNGAWQEVGKGWSYQAGLRNELRSTYRISTTHLEVTKALGETVTDAGSRRILQELVITEEVVITNSHALFALIPTADLLIDGLKRDRVFLASVKGDKGADGKSVTVSEVTSSLKQDSAFLASVKGERGVQGIKGADGKSVTVSEVTTSLKQDSAFLASVKGERGVQGIKGADGKSVTVSEVTSSLKQDSAFLASVKGERGVQGIKGADGKSVTVSEVTTSLKQDSAFLASVKGERGVQGIKGADGKSVTVSEVTSSLKQDSAFLASVKGERGVQGLKGADGKSVTVSEVTTSLKQDSAFLASVKGERGVQGIKGADGKSVTVSEVTTSLKQDSAFLASVKGERGVQGLKGADGKSVTVSEVTTSLKQDSAFLASVKGERGERGVQGIKGADGTSVTPQDAVTALLRDQASLTRIRSNVLESNDATQFVKNRIKKEVIQAYTLSASNNVMRLPSIYTIEDGATYRIAIINNSSCMISFNIVAEQEIITPMFESLGYNHDQKALFCKGAFALFERLGDRWLWRNYCDYAYYEDDAKKLQKELRLSNIEDNITELKNGSTKSFINLNSINTGSYKLKPDDHIIFARETGNGDRNPWIYLDNPNIKIGAIFYIIVPREDILCEFKLPSGASAFGNTKVRKGMHMLIKTWTTEWIITSMTTI